jgi:multiple sugar transport system permease protein
MVKNRKQNGRAAQLAEARVGLLLVLPLILWVTIILVVPLLYGFWLTFQNATVLGAPSKFIGLANYVSVITEKSFVSSFRLSLLWVVGNAVVQTLAGFTVALLLNYPLRRYRPLQPLIIMSWVVPAAISALIWKWMLSASYGVINNLLLQVGVLSQPIVFLGKPDLTMLSVILVNSWRWFPFFAIILLAALQNIPRDEYDAAVMEGASGAQQFWYITKPYLGPTLAVVGLIGTILSFNIFDVIYLMTNGGPMGLTTTLPVLIYKRAFEAYQMSQAATIGAYMFFATLGFALFVFYGRRVWWRLSELAARAMPRSSRPRADSISTRLHGGVQ